MKKAKQKPRRMVSEKALPKIITHRATKRPPRVGDGSGKWQPKVGG
jgi:hypothetical protein